MNELLGMLDALTGLISESRRIPLTDKVVLEERMVLGMIERIRCAVQNQDVIRRSVDQSRPQLNIEVSATGGIQSMDLQDDEIVMAAKTRADAIRAQSNEYADQVLSHLQLLVTKMQKNVIKIEKSIEEGRQFLFNATPSSASADQFTPQGDPE